MSKHRETNSSPKTHNRKQKNNQGFTLVEMSIVLVVLALIVAGIVGGKSLVHSAKLRSVISDANKIKIAVRMYRDSYDAWPGDHRNAKDYWPNPLCVDSGSNKCNGNGDGRIAGSSQEEVRLWQHLSLSEMLPKSYSGVGLAPAPGVNIPKGSFDGTYFWLRYTAIGSTIQNLLEFKPIQAALTPSDAQTIDKKIDDGKYGYGKVRGFGNGCTGGGKYYVQNKNRACSMFFLLVN